MTSGNTVAIAAAKEAVKAAELAAEKTSAGKAAGGAYSRRAAPHNGPNARAASHNLYRPGPGEPSGFLVVLGRAERVRGRACVVAPQ